MDREILIEDLVKIGNLFLGKTESISLEYSTCNQIELMKIINKIIKNNDNDNNSRVKRIFKDEITDLKKIEEIIDYIKNQFTYHDNYDELIKNCMLTIFYHYSSLFLEYNITKTIVGNNFKIYQN